MIAKNKLIHIIKCPTFSQWRNSFLAIILHNIQKQDSPLNSRMQTHIYAVLVIHIMDYFLRRSMKVKVQACRYFTHQWKKIRGRGYGILFPRSIASVRIVSFSLKRNYRQLE